MRNNIKHLLSSEGWRELKIEMENRMAEVDKEILAEANKSTPSINSLHKLSADRKALKELIELPASLIEEGEEIEDLL